MTIRHMQTTVHFGTFTPERALRQMVPIKAMDLDAAPAEDRKPS